MSVVSDFKRDDRGAVAILLALLLIPMVAVIGLAVDYAVFSQTTSSLSLAANAAALNAAKIAAASELNGDGKYQSEGQTAGMNWFTEQLSSNFSNLTVTPSVTVGGTSDITATVSYTTSIPSIFGKIFSVLSYPVGGSALAEVNTAPFLEVVVLMDNSASMALGATTADMETLLLNSPCAAANEYTWNGTIYTSTEQIPYSNYSCTNYDASFAPGLPSCPVAGYTVDTTATAGPQTCPGTVNGRSPKSGMPCAFACHSDGSKPAGQGNDLWAEARQLGVKLRFDLVKSATNDVLTSMQSDAALINNNSSLSVGIYTFNTGITKVYPATGEAGSDWTAAMTAVGSPPANGSYVDTGIQPAVAGISGTNNDTNFEQSMSSLATTYVTASGDGTTAASPQKVLFLITDGVDDNNGVGNASLYDVRSAMPYSACQQFKTMGYKVYVVYTEYYPVMHTYYEQHMISYVEGTGTNSIAYNLQACSSSTSSSDLGTYYVEATQTNDIDAALQSFLKSALNSPARFSDITNQK